MLHGNGSPIELPLPHRTRKRWAELAADRLNEFLADHAICEQQAALFALNLVAHYPDDAELVNRMTSLAAEEVRHLRRVASLLQARGSGLSRRRPNAYVRQLRQRISGSDERRLKVDRLIVGALIEARSCERFVRLIEVIGDRDPEVAKLLSDLEPAERRHWQMFHRLAAREVEPAWFDRHWREWLEAEQRINAAGGTAPTVHG